MLLVSQQANMKPEGKIFLTSSHLSAAADGQNLLHLAASNNVKSKQKRTRSLSSSCRLFCRRCELFGIAVVTPPPLCRRWSSWTWMSGRTSGDLVPGRTPGSIRSSSTPGRTKTPEVLGRRAEQAGRCGATHQMRAGGILWRGRRWEPSGWALGLCWTFNCGCVCRLERVHSFHSRLVVIYVEPETLK